VAEYLAGWPQPKTIRADRDSLHMEHMSGYLCYTYEYIMSVDKRKPYNYLVHALACQTSQLIVVLLKPYTKHVSIYFWIMKTGTLIHDPNEVLSVRCTRFRRLMKAWLKPIWEKLMSWVLMRSTVNSILYSRYLQSSLSPRSLVMWLGLLINLNSNHCPRVGSS